MEPSELIAHVTAVLRQEQLEYFLTGSIAAMAYSAPRFTHDLDVVVRLDVEQSRRLIAHFPPGEWYVSEVAALDAVDRRGQFNVIHIPTGFKVDLMVARDDAFDASRFARVRQIEVAGGATERIAAPEDVILKKLVYYQIGGSEKHILDAVGILKHQPGQIDLDYLRRWAPELAIQDVLDKVLAHPELAD